MTAITRLIFGTSDPQLAQKELVENQARDIFARFQRVQAAIGRVEQMPSLRGWVIKELGQIEEQAHKVLEGGRRLTEEGPFFSLLAKNYVALRGDAESKLWVSNVLWERAKTVVGLNLNRRELAHLLQLAAKSVQPRVIRNSKQVILVRHEEGEEPEFYLRLKFLGQGAFRRVFSALKIRGEELSLSTVAVSTRGAGSELASEATYRDQIPDGEHIIGRPAFTVWEGPHFWIAGTPLAKSDLWHHIYTAQPDQKEMIRLMLGIAKGLVEFHQWGAHLDIKEPNILVGGQGQVWLNDFDGSKSHEALKRDRRLVGTPSYAAPEIWQRWKRTTKADIYSFGRMLRRYRRRLPQAPALTALRIACLRINPKMRPDAPELVARLESIYRRMS